MIQKKQLNYAVYEKTSISWSILFPYIFSSNYYSLFNLEFMKYKTLFLVLSTTCGAVATTMFIGNFSFQAKFGLILPFTFLTLQAIFFNTNA